MANSSPLKVLSQIQGKKYVNFDRWDFVPPPGLPMNSKHTPDSHHHDDIDHHDDDHDSLTDRLVGKRYVCFDHPDNDVLHIDQSEDEFEDNHVHDHDTVEGPAGDRHHSESVDGMAVPTSAAVDHGRRDRCGDENHMDDVEEKICTLQSIFDRSMSSGELSQEELFQALVEAEEASVQKAYLKSKSMAVSLSKYGSAPQRVRVGGVTKWPATAPMLVKLLTYWESPSCHLGGNHKDRLGYLQRYLGFEVTGGVIRDPDQKKLRLRSSLCDTGKINRYLDFLASNGQAPGTILKTVDVLKSSLEWIAYHHLLPGASNFTKRFMKCTQALERLHHLRTAWSTTRDRDNRRTSTIGSIIRSNRWPHDEEVRTIVDVNFEKYQCLRTRLLSNKDMNCQQSPSTSTSAVPVHVGAPCSDDCTPSLKPITNKDVRWVVSLVANALTIHVTFGRPSLFQGLTVDEGRRATRRSSIQDQHGTVIGSSDFKTWRLWFLQSMYFSPGVQNLVRDWLDLWRPLWASSKVESSQEPLFINTEGNGITNWSDYLSILWEETFGRPMTSTVLRYWKATKVALCAHNETERRLVIEQDWYIDLSVCDHVFVIFIAVPLASLLYHVYI